MIIKYNNYNSFFAAKKGKTFDFRLYCPGGSGMTIRNSVYAYDVNLDDLLKFGILTSYYSNMIIRNSVFTDFEIKEIQQYLLKLMKLKRFV